MIRFWLALLVVSTLPAVAHAQAGNGAFHMRLHGGLFETRSVTIGEAPDELEGSATVLGIVAPMGGLTLGYQLGDLAMIGMDFMLASETQETFDEEEIGVSSLSFLPFFELMFGPGSVARPYLHLGLGYSNLTNELSTGDEVSSDGITFLGSFGVHILATPSFAISPSLYLRYVGGSLETTGSRSGFGSSTSSVDRSELAFGIALGVGGFIGGDDEPAGSEQEWSQGGRGPDDAAPARPAQDDFAPPAGPRVESDDLLTRVVLDRASLDLLGRPSRDGQTVLLRLSQLVISPTLRGCEEVRLQMDGQTLTLTGVRYDSRPSGRGIQETLLVPAPRAALERIPGGDVVSIRVCSESYVVPPFARARIGSFLERFRREALAYDTLEGGGDVTTAAPPPDGPVDEGEAAEPDPWNAPPPEDTQPEPTDGEADGEPASDPADGE